MTERAVKTCAECDQPLPARSTRRRIHCGPACRQKAYARREKERVAALEATSTAGSGAPRGLDAFPEGSARRAAELLGIAARRLAEACDGATDPLHGEELEQFKADFQQQVTALMSLVPVPVVALAPSLDDLPVPPMGTKGDVTADGENRWTVSIDGVAVGTIELHNFQRVTFGVRSGYSEWSGRTAGGREVWSGGPPRDLDDAARMIVSDVRRWLMARHEVGAKPTLGRARADGSRRAPGGEVRPVTFPARWWTAQTFPGSGWTAHSAKGNPPIVDAAGQPVVRPDAIGAATVLAEWRWQQADDFWCGREANEAWRPPDGEPA